MTYDRVLPELLRVCEEAPIADQVDRYCVVRDVRGRVHLVVKPQGNCTLQLDALERSLASALGAYFLRPILSPQSRDEQGRLAGLLLDLAQRQPWPRTWPRQYSGVLGESSSIRSEHWAGLDRTIGKEAWLVEGRGPPWPLPAQAAVPPIVAFHSFKGGVGRTTITAAHAIAKANAGQRVAAVDLDLEAPGIAQLLGVRPTRGVLDVLVDHLATGSVDLHDVGAQARLDHDVDKRITVYPAGNLDQHYLGKLARLDYVSAEPGQDSPVEAALTGLLKALKKEHDLILLDARAGLHDLSGMSLHRLAHVDVLVFRGTKQHLTGLEATLATLGDRLQGGPVLVETLLPPREDEARVRQQHTRDMVYEMMNDHVYPEDSEPPQLDDRDAPHWALPLGRKEWLDALDHLAGQVNAVVGDGELAAISGRIDDAASLSVSPVEGT